MSRRWTHNRLLFTKLRLLKNLKKTLIIGSCKQLNKVNILRANFDKSSQWPGLNSAQMLVLAMPL